MRKTQDLVFSGLHLPRPLELAAVKRLLARLASDRGAPRVVLEVRADGGHIRYLVGCRATDVHGLRRLLADLIPGTVLTTPQPDQGESRPTVEVAARLRIQPPGLPLLSDTAEATTWAVLSALAVPLRAGECLVVQIVLGPRHAPRLVPASAPAPGTSLLSALAGGGRPASPEIRNRVKERLSQGGFAATIRFGGRQP